jgi:hypothetical protein
MDKFVARPNIQIIESNWRALSLSPLSGLFTMRNPLPPLGMAIPRYATIFFADSRFASCAGRLRSDTGLKDSAASSAVSSD